MAGTFCNWLAQPDQRSGVFPAISAATCPASGRGPQHSLVKSGTPHPARVNLPGCRRSPVNRLPVRVRRRSAQNTTPDPAVNATVRSTVITCADLPLPTAPPDRLVFRGVNDVDNGQDDDS